MTKNKNFKFTDTKKVIKKGDTVYFIYMELDKDNHLQYLATKGIVDSFTSEDINFLNDNSHQFRMRYLIQNAFFDKEACLNKLAILFLRVKMKAISFENENTVSDKLMLKIGKLLKIYEHR